ncbi:MAG: hypothetical protein Ta2B_29630 [Termitinemataceae bacterium]|nr:MAG: hypothetical protein Ta2B_29630 [Termitinemataceae bacterium]
MKQQHFFKAPLNTMSTQYRGERHCNTTAHKFLAAPFSLKPFGICVLLISAISFLRGLYKGELVLRLLGAALFMPMLYSFVCCIFLAVVHKKKAHTIYANISPKTINIGQDVFVSLNKIVSFFSMPAILIRYKIQLQTKDKKTINHIFEKKFFKSNEGSTFPAVLRGAYYGNSDAVLIADIFGFFSVSILIEQLTEQNSNNFGAERLLILPSVSNAINIDRSYSGGENEQSENRILKSDDLLDQRIYIPGDDPRRINWKLFSHIGELFVRTEEMRHPPHSKLTLLIDTEYDPSLFSLKEAAALLDDMCTAAFSLVLENEQHNILTELSYNAASVDGYVQKYHNGTSAALAEVLSYPAATIDGAEFPNSSTSAIVIMTMVSTLKFSRKSLQTFLAHKPPAQTIELFFCYNKSNMLGASEACALNYCRINGLRTKSVLL